MAKGGRNIRDCARVVEIQYLTKRFQAYNGRKKHLGKVRIGFGTGVVP